MHHAISDGHHVIDDRRQDCLSKQVHCVNGTWYERSSFKVSILSFERDSSFRAAEVSLVFTASWLISPPPSSHSHGPYGQPRTVQS